jgi:hypothetical protein
MTSERIKEIQATTGYPDSVSIKQALLQVWNECEQSHPSPMSAEQVEELGYYYPLFKFFSDEHGLSLLDSQLQDVIHECKKFIEPSTTGESWKAEYDNCRALLQELVSLKVMKENLYKGNPDGKEYAERKPKAWQAAQQFLSTYQHEGLSTSPSVKADGWVSVEDVERLQSEIHKITGDGEVMMLFNKLLGNSAK